MKGTYVDCVMAVLFEGFYRVKIITKAYLLVCNRSNISLIYVAVLSSVKPSMGILNDSGAIRVLRNGL